MPSPALLYGEAPAAVTVQTIARTVRNVSARLMKLSPEDWAAIQESEPLSELAVAADELKITVTAMRGDSPRTTPTCLPAQVRDALRVYRRRLQFFAVNLRLADPGSRELLAEILHFDRWQAAHLLRCADYAGAR